MAGVFLVAVQLGFVALLVWRSGEALASPWSLTGLIVSALWLLWAVWSMPRRTLKIHPVPAEQGKLCRTRAYRYVRHPMYGAVLLAALIVAWAEGGWLTLFCWLGLVVVLWIKSTVEENHLAKKYPEYEEYRRSTPRWIPFWPMNREKWTFRCLRAVGWMAAFLLLATLGWNAFENQWDEKLFEASEAKNVRAEEAGRLIDSTPDLLVLDVRTEREFSGRRLPHAVNIPIGDPEFPARLDKALTGKSAILVYCAGGYRSRKVVERIQEQNLKLPLYHLHRGMLEWP